MLLVKEELWHTVNEEAGDRKDSDLRSYLKKSEKALSTIALMVDDSQVILIERAVSARDAWNLLKEHHQQSTMSFKVRVLKRLFKMKLPIGGDMHVHLDTMFSMIKELLDRGFTLSVEMVVSIMLSSCNEEYDSLVTGIET